MRWRLLICLVLTPVSGLGSQPPEGLPAPTSMQAWPEVLGGPAGTPPPWPDLEEGLPVFVSVEGQVLRPMLQRWSTSGLVGAEVLRYPRNFALDWTVAPEVSLGYRLWDRLFLMGRYRVIDAFGRRERPAEFAAIFLEAAADILALGNGDPYFAGLRAQRAEWTMHQADLGLAFLDRHSPIGVWRWEVALRYVHVDGWLDSVWTNQQPFLAPGIDEIPLLAAQHARQRFEGLGPQLGVESVVPLLPQINLQVRLEGGLVIGEATHTYNHLIDLVTLQHLAAGEISGPALAPNLRLQVGFVWQWHVGRSLFELTTGYQYEKWWFIGREDEFGVRGYYPSIDLQNHGPFIRALLRF